MRYLDRFVNIFNLTVLNVSLKSHNIESFGLKRYRALTAFKTIGLLLAGFNKLIYLIHLVSTTVGLHLPKLDNIKYSTFCYSAVLAIHS